MTAAHINGHELCPGNAGTTLLEIVVWTALLAGIGSPAVMGFLTSTRVMSEANGQREVHERARVLIHRMEREIRLAIGTSMETRSDGTALTFTLPLGFTQVGVRAGSAIRYELEIDSGEASNGIDDDGDQLSDEGQLTRTNLVTGERVVLASNLDLAGSSFVKANDTMVLTLSCLGFLRHSGAIIKASRTRTVNPRN